MKLIIDAWLERPVPYLKIVDCETGITLARFEGAELQRLHTEGVVSTQVLTTDFDGQVALVEAKP